MENKHASKQQADEPNNRLEVYLYTLKYNLVGLFKTGLALLLFFAPLIALFAIRQFLLYDLGESVKSVDKIFNIYNMVNILAIPLSFVASIGISGCLNVIKKISWNENKSFIDEFKLGIKESYTQTAITTAILAFFNFVMNLNYIIINQENSGFLMTISIICVCFLLLLTPTFIYIYNQIIIYKQKLFSIYKFSLILYISTLFKTLLVFVLSLIPYCLLFIPNTIFQIIALIFLVFAYGPTQLQILFLYSSSIFDKYVNPNNFPELIRKGLKKL